MGLCLEGAIHCHYSGHPILASGFTDIPTAQHSNWVGCCRFKIFVGHVISLSLYALNCSQCVASFGLWAA